MSNPLGYSMGIALGIIISVSAKITITEFATDVDFNEVGRTIHLRGPKQLRPIYLSVWAEPIMGPTIHGPCHVTCKQFSHRHSSSQFR